MQHAISLGYSPMVNGVARAFPIHGHEIIFETIIGPHPTDLGRKRGPCKVDTFQDRSTVVTKRSDSRWTWGKHGGHMLNVCPK